MTATQKTLTPYLDPNRAFDKELLNECADISLNQRAILNLGIKSPESTYAVDAVSLNKTVSGFNFCEVSLSNMSQLNIKQGDVVRIYSKNNKGKDIFFRSCVKELTSTYIILFDDIPDIATPAMIAKEELLYLSNKNCTMEDKWGVERQFEARLEATDIEYNMGEMFDYGWNQSEVSFKISNLDGFYDKYLAGGANFTNFQGKDVSIYLGFGSKLNQNILLFEGFLHFNSPLSEEDKRLSVSAYLSSERFNIPIPTNVFADNILDEDMRGEVIPILLGDWSTSGKLVGSLERPIVKTTLLSYWTTQLQAKITLLKSDMNTLSDVYIYANAAGTAGNDHKIVVEYHSDNMTGTDPLSCLTETVDGSGKYTWKVSLFTGTSSTGVLLSSSQHLAQVLASSTYFNSNFTISNTRNVSLPTYSQSYPSNQIIKTVTYTLSGGATVNKAEYKVCANPINQTQPRPQVWFCKGDYDDPTAWESNYNVLSSGGVPTPVVPTYNASTGTILVSGIDSSYVTLNSQGKLPLLDYKMYAYVRGEQLNNVTYPNDSNVFLNVPFTATSLNSYTVPTYYSDKSSQGAEVKAIGSAKVVSNASFNLKSALQTCPFYLTKTPEVPRTCRKFGPITINCWGGTPAYYTPTYASAKYTFKAQEITNTKDFVFDVEFNHQSMAPLLNSLTTFEGTAYSTILSLQKVVDNQYVNYLKLQVWNSNGVRRLVVDINGKKTVTSGGETVFDHNYRIRVKKKLNVITIFLKDLDASGTWQTLSLDTQPTFTSSDNAKIVRAVLGSDYTTEPSAKDNHGRFQIGTLRIANNSEAFQDENFVSYQDAYIYTDIVSVAKRILELGGAQERHFGKSWKQLSENKVATNFDGRIYLDENDKLTMEAASDLLGQIGFVITMQEEDGSFRFQIIPDTLEFLQNNKEHVITSHDIEFGSVSFSNEVNQLFNTATASYNKVPGEDEYVTKSAPYYEPKSYEKDNSTYKYFEIRKDDIIKDTIELPNLYQSSDVVNVIADRIANSTPNSEMISMTVSWRHLTLKIGDFVTLNHDRWVNVPCQVRKIKIDASGTKMDITLRSLQNVQFTDFITQQQYTPANYNSIGGDTGKANVIAKI